MSQKKINVAEQDIISWELGVTKPTDYDRLLLSSFFTFQ